MRIRALAETVCRGGPGPGGPELPWVAAGWSRLRPALDSEEVKYLHCFIPAPRRTPGRQLADGGPRAEGRPARAQPRPGHHFRFCLPVQQTARRRFAGLWIGIRSCHPALPAPPQTPRQALPQFHTMDTRRMPPGPSIGNSACLCCSRAAARPLRRAPADGRIGNPPCGPAGRAGLPAARLR